MRNLLFVILSAFFLSSCAKEQTIAVKADFNITVVDSNYSVPVKVEITNTSSGADTYQWSFEGATVTNSTDINPKPVYYIIPGTYNIILKASNKDGSQDTKTIQIKIDSALTADFDWQMQGSNIAPVTLQLNNKSLGATAFQWTFEGGKPATSTDKNPQVVFTDSGTHKIQLTTTNGRISATTEKTVSILPALAISFNWTVDFVNQDYQVPVTLHMHNTTIDATSYEWTFTNNPNNIISTAQNPDITITTAGTYTLQLKASNDKESKTAQQQVTIYPDKNLLSFTGIKLGINTAQNSIGCFFSSVLGQVITSNAVTGSNGASIDIAFFGMDASFSYNQFISPDEVQQTAFNAIPNAIHTKIINRQELVGTQLTASQFDAISDGSGLAGPSITQTDQGLTPFDGTQSNRIILFQTADGRKGAIKVTQYVAGGKDSYILADIKIQKHT